MYIDVMTMKQTGTVPTLMELNSLMREIQGVHKSGDR